MKLKTNSKIFLSLLALYSIYEYSFNKAFGSTQKTINETVDITINSKKATHKISPLIFGMNRFDDDVLVKVKPSIMRWGGNDTSRYNINSDTTSLGKDYFFQNIPKPKDFLSTLVNRNKSANINTIITLPLLGWIPKRRKEEHPYDCSFSITKYGLQDDVDTWDTDCGNGFKDNLALTNNNPQDASILFSKDYQSKFLNLFIREFGLARNGGVRFYSLDNEPMLWHKTHRDVVKKPINYTDLLDKQIKGASIIKQTDPTAATLGPVLWGWCAYFFSAQDGCKAGSDYRKNQNLSFLPWYLKQFYNQEKKNKIRLLDFLDVHIYPQGDNIYSQNPGTIKTQKLRLRSTNSLWDKSYIDESWINQPIYLIKRLKNWIDLYYPGTKIAISEYNWGGFSSVNGAIAQADILGIFGSEGVDIATHWEYPKATMQQPGVYAFQIYTNFDGKGSAFGLNGVNAASSNREKVSVYSSLQDKGNLTTIFINKSFNTVLADVSHITNKEFAAEAETYTFSSINSSSILANRVLLPDLNKFKLTLPAQSICLLLLHKQ
ncbi:glycoside hydrolase family 44 protein [Synechococcus sp. CC9311]|uniref:glycoside hydrolase family 44 protein n=1 Tax=Synechococcus sp. (strain CC9311) TaxID=64471 RepID=UPI0000DDAEA6|nr:glycoside hydrolase family 44 protein [Synechococcus sp. CC9311]ABI45742.1 endoglucanase [Synechococcus sp. CC9311]